MRDLLLAEAMHMRVVYCVGQIVRRNRAAKVTPQLDVSVDRLCAFLLANVCTVVTPKTHSKDPYRALIHVR